MPGQPPRAWLARAHGETSATNQGRQYNRNAETSMEVGEAMGKAMVELMKNE